jgi:cephalosporin-C deacetylase
VSVDLASRPADFEAYWDSLDRELARYPGAPELEPLPLRSSAAFAVYALKLTSVGPYRIFGYYSRPAGRGPFPGLLRTPGYGSVNHIPPYDQRERYAVLQIMHRGQRLADQPFAASYPGLLTHGLEAPTGYVYRGIAADCLRAAEFLLARPEVDPQRVGLLGDDLALLTAARRPGFAAVQVEGCLLYRALQAAARTSAYPLEELNDYLRAFPERRAAAARSLSYLDPLHHAPSIRAPVFLGLQAPGALGGPEWLQPLAETLPVRPELYPLSHEGATDHDRFDAWLARQLGAEPRPRLTQREA